MAKTDLSAMFKEVWKASEKPKLLDVPPLDYLMFDGKGRPDLGPDFTQAMGALFSTAFTLKFMLKAKGSDFKVMAPETIWHMEGEGMGDDPAEWRWTAMVPVPGFVKKADVEGAIEAVKERYKKKKEPVPAVDKLRLERLTEGKCVQMMQFGPYEKAAESYEKLKRFAKENGFKIAGDCKEIYYNDPHKVAPGQIKTLVRYPVKKK